MNIFEQSLHPGASTDLHLWHRHLSQHHSAHVTTLCVISAVYWTLSITLLYPAPCNCYWQGIQFLKLVNLLMTRMSLIRFIFCFVLQLILTSQYPFKLSGKVLQVLVSIFLYHDFSVRNFVKGLQVSRCNSVTVYCFLISVYMVNSLAVLRKSAYSCPVGPVGALSLTASQCALLWEKGVSGLCTEVEPPRCGDGSAAALFHEVTHFP